MALHPGTVKKLEAALGKHAQQAPQPKQHVNPASEAKANPKTSGYGKGPGKISGTPARAAPGVLAAAPATMAAGTPAGTTPPPAAPLPYLTPAQQAALDNYNAKYNGDVTSLTSKLSQDTATTNANLATAKQSHDISTDSANQNAAARGMFQSSIRDSALNDIDTTLATKSNILNTQLQSDALNTQNSMATLAAQYAAQHNYYDALAVENAGADDTTGTDAPTVTGPTTTGAVATPVAHGTAVNPINTAGTAAPTKTQPMLPQVPAVGFNPGFKAPAPAAGSAPKANQKVGGFGKAPGKLTPGPAKLNNGAKPPSSMPAGMGQ